MVCNPLGAECDNAQMGFDALSMRLVGLGMAVLRFDYDGTGDSAGSWTQDDRLGSWLASVRAAVDFAATLGPPVGAVGMRMGALFCMEALRGRGGADALVLWDPCPNGRQFLREQSLLLSAAYGEGQPGGGAAEGPATYFEPEAAAALSAFDPLRDGDAPMPAPAVLVLTREGRSLGPSLGPLVDRAGVEWGTVRGQADLLDVPGISTVDEGDVAAVAKWLAEQLPGEASPVSVDAPTATHMAVDGGTVVEEAVDLGDLPLFGIRCRRADGPTGSGRGPTAVFLTAGILHRSGPARMWTDLARRWALLGVPSLRVDLSGTGYSGVRSGQIRNIALAPEAIDDLRCIADALEASDSRGLVYVGLSAGGYLAVEAALQSRPLGVCPVNPSITTRPPERLGLIPDPDGAGADRRAHRTMPFRRLRHRHKRVADSLARAANQVLVHRAPAGPLVQAARRGSHVLLVATQDEAAFLRPSVYWGAAAWHARRQGLYRTFVVPGHDHSLYLRATRAPAMDAMTDWVAGLSAPPPA